MAELGIFTRFVVTGATTMMLGTSGSSQMIQQVVSSSGGTLILTVPTAKGLLVCADRRIKKSISGEYSDTQLKIYPMGKKGFFIVTGSYYLLGSKGEQVYSTVNLVKEYLGKNAFADNPRF